MDTLAKTVGYAVLVMLFGLGAGALSGFIGDRWPVVTVVLFVAIALGAGYLMARDNAR
jgi:hypothetical protein